MRLCKCHNEVINLICECDLSVLCCKCIPAHSKEHMQSNSLMLIKQVPEFIYQCNKCRCKLIGQMDRLNSRFKQIVDVNKWYELSNLNALKKELVTTIQQIFEEIEMEFNRIVELRIEDHQYNIYQIIQQLQNTILKLDTKQQLIQIEKCVQFHTALKFNNKMIEDVTNKLEKIEEQGIQLPFKAMDNTLIRKQIVEIIYKRVQNIHQTQDKQQTVYHQQIINIDKHKHEDKIQSNTINTNTNTSTKSNIKLVSKISTTREKKKKKQCEYCGEELEYLTDLKKHLVCRSCGNKQRNYVKRI